MLVGSSKFTEIVSKTHIPVLRSMDNIKKITIAVSVIKNDIINYIDSIESNEGYGYYIGDMNGENNSPNWIEREFISTEQISDIVGNIENIIYSHLNRENLINTSK